MKYIIFLIFFISSLLSQELKIKANNFSADEKIGLSVFEGDVSILKGLDELNASKVSVYTDKKHHPTKFIADGNVSFTITTKKGSKYQGKAEKVIYVPQKKEYLFLKNVHLKQIDERKEIIGDEVVLKTIEGIAYAKGVKKEPVIIIFKLPEENE